MSGLGLCPKGAALTKEECRWGERFYLGFCGGLQGSQQDPAPVAQSGGLISHSRALSVWPDFLASPHALPGINY